MLLLDSAEVGSSDEMSDEGAEDGRVWVVLSTLEVVVGAAGLGARSVVVGVTVLVVGGSGCFDVVCWGLWTLALEGSAESTEEAAEDVVAAPDPSADMLGDTPPAPLPSADVSGSCLLPMVRNLCAGRLWGT